jgi:hypothetical protein
MKTSYLSVMGIIAAAIAGVASAQSSVNRYVQFTRATDTIKINGNTRFNSGPFTYEMRVWVDGNGAIITEQRDREEDKGVILGPGSFYNSVLGVFSGSAPTLSGGMWHHYVWTSDGSTDRVFVDGQLVASRPHQAGSQYPDSPTSWMALGKFYYAAGCCPSSWDSFIGRLDWIRITAAALYTAPFVPPAESQVTSTSSTQLLLKFNEPAGTTILIDESPNRFVCEVGAPPAPGYFVTAPRVGQLDCTAPAVTTQPTAASTCAGSPVSLTATFSGTSPMFQWRKNGTNVPGATSATLTLASPSLADAGSYDCEATNSCGSVTTAAATLTVTPLLTIATQPVDQNVGVDTPVIFLVQTEAHPGCATPLSFQWQRRNPLVQDADAPNAWLNLQDGPQFVNTQSSALGIARPLPALATGYRCRIGGGCGCRPTGGFIYTDTVNFGVACPADFNADGGIDGQDIFDFFERWENGC